MLEWFVNGCKQVAKDVSDTGSLFVFTLTNGRASGDSRVRPGVGKLDFTWMSLGAARAHG